MRQMWIKKEVEEREGNQRVNYGEINLENLGPFWNPPTCELHAHRRATSFSAEPHG